MFLRAFKYLWPERFLPEPEQADPFEERMLPALGKTGVLLVNLGTPQAATAPEIRRYLGEFLADPRVIEIPRYLWWPILHGLVLTLRPRKLVPRYRGIWMDGGSPLMVYSRRQAEGLSRLLAQRGLQVEVALGMRYGSPAVADAMDELRRRGCERILVVPMYPQYAASTTATVVDAVGRHAARLRDQPELRFIKRFHDDPGYVQAIVGKIERYWAEHGRPQKLVMSFHGLPRYSVELGDPYYQDCLRTGRLLRERLGLMPEQALVTFQSRFGSARWLEPYTAPTVMALARDGVTEVDVVCPGFLADCLETLEEVQVECRDAFIEAGGKRLRYIPALNDDETWIAALSELVQRQLQGWPA
ncbi:ferrochelatase [Bordetella genomosp. 9]|uniref:Ferrochelatase n=1 Tax=Bordetella genomosp. 9 TaxID=1416803 RepID=A0A261RPF5_9BORD|nr:ferrochelatase [Bordetella genomosp. 9]OZI26791.1 ferrochelatase [Bordetella genomosp. 9]